MTTNTTLQELRDALRQGMGMSMQRSYERRAPAAESLPILRKARDGLHQFVEGFPTNAEAWRLLSQAEESLLDFRQATACLEKAMEVAGTRSKSDLKRLVRLNEHAQAWATLGLSPDQLHELGLFLRSKGADNPAKGRSLSWTDEWLGDNEIPDRQRVLENLRARGGYSDFQVLYNVVRG